MTTSSIADGIDLVWRGPYEWFDAKGRSVFSGAVAAQPGIYMWTVPYQGCHLAYYVGETGTSFQQRMNEHAQNYLFGVYQIHDPDEFSAGRHRLIWPGTFYMPNPGPEWPRFDAIRLRLYQSLACLRLLVVPLEVEARVRKRIEGAIARATQRFPRPSEARGGFQEYGIRYARPKQGELPILVRMKCPVTVLGLDADLTA
jgi:hypothetical protein